MYKDKYQKLSRLCVYVVDTYDDFNNAIFSYFIIIGFNFFTKIILNTKVLILRDVDFFVTWDRLIVIIWSIYLPYT